MPVYINPHTYVVHLVGPDGASLRVKPHQRIVLADYFDKYRVRGFLRFAESQTTPEPPPSKIQARIKLGDKRRPQPQVQASTPSPVKPRKDELVRARKIAAAKVGARKPAPSTHLRPQSKQVVGKVSSRDPNELLRINLAHNAYPISNGVGVGILSYNRAEPLRRLINSIIRNTDLRRTTVFISDDNSDDPATIAYLDELSRDPNFVVIRNPVRGGVSCNSNRLLRCLSRFSYGLLLNDDVEVLAPGWEHFYEEVMVKTGLHHLMYRQSGVYGADRGAITRIADTQLLVVDDKPHGAVLAFTNQFLRSVGFFDESYGLYGMEHVDWSQRAWELGLQKSGFFDAYGSDSYFKLHAEVSVVTNRSKLLQDARSVFTARQARYVEPTDKSQVPEVAYVVPFRDFERTNSIATVMNNLRAQRYPVVHLIMVEQDSQSRIGLAAFIPVNHYLATATNQLFNKSKAFNLGVSRAPCEIVILHDADMLAQGHYTEAVATILQEHESCHIGSTVMYTTTESMQAINSTGIVDGQVKCDRIVGYYEGGSLAATKTGYWKSGGFNEDYWGYGCEDCDFYARLSQSTKWKEDRIFDFLHLWHSRVGGWNDHHDANKALESSLKRLNMVERLVRQHQQLRSLGYSAELTKSLE